jgi:hypothetical protein
MTKTEQFIQALKSVPQEVYAQFVQRAQVLSYQYPSAFGMDCFARGEGIEYGFLDCVKNYIDLKPNTKGQANDPDYVFAGNIFPDAKTQCGGLKPQKTGKKMFYSNQWDIQKKAQGASEFKSKADCYVLIDPHFGRIAVIDSAVFYAKKFKQGSARISFPVKPEDVTMIYDGSAHVSELDVKNDPNAIFKQIWDNTLKYV